MGVVHDRQHGEDHGDLHAAVEVAARSGTDRDPLGDQNAAEHAAHSIGRAQEDCNVTEMNRPLHVAVPNSAPLHEGKDLPGGLERLRLEIGVFRFLPGEEKKFRNRAVCSPGQARNQHVRRSVLKAAQPLGHAAAEDRIHGIQDLRCGTEVLLKPNHAFPASGFGIKAAFFIENLRIGKPEAVDRLLQVSDEEQVLPSPADRAEDPVLNPADILVFVHHHLGESSRDLFGGFGRGTVLPGQQADGQVLQIGKIQGIGAGLCPAKLVFQVQNHREQRAHIARGVPQVGEDL